MCPYCDYSSHENMIFKEPLTKERYLKVIGICGRNLDINE